VILRRKALAVAPGNCEELKVCLAAKQTVTDFTFTWKTTAEMAAVLPIHPKTLLRLRRLLSSLFREAMHFRRKGLTTFGPGPAAGDWSGCGAR